MSLVSITSLLSSGGGREEAAKTLKNVQIKNLILENLLTPWRRRGGGDQRVKSSRTLVLNIGLLCIMQLFLAFCHEIYLLTTSSLPERKTCTKKCCENTVFAPHTVGDKTTGGWYLKTTFFRSWVQGCFTVAMFPSFLGCHTVQRMKEKDRKIDR